MTKQSSVFMLVFCVGILFSQSIAQTPAFPGAEGFGANAIGGRGGIILKVTNLNDSGEGSLRNAITTQGPRTVVFAISGTIVLNTPLVITEPYITIAGQTAPGDGIALKNSGAITRAILEIDTHDVVIRHIRSRPGPDNSEQGSGNLDAVAFRGQAFNVILDHVSLSWAVDEVADIFGTPHDITLQWCILSEGLYCSNHQKSKIPGGNGVCPTGGPPHSRGMTISTPPGSANSPDNISLHHNLWASSNKRYPNLTSNTFVDFVNNGVYNFGEFASRVLRKTAGWVVRMNYVGNYLKPGPETFKEGSPYVFDFSNQPVPSGGFEVFLSGNEIISPIQAGWAGWGGLADPAVLDSRIDAPPVTTTSAEQAWQDVLADAGATLAARDAVDLRIVNDAWNGTGNFIDDPSDVGGWPELMSIQPPADSDDDGMPDFWEDQFGLNKNDASDNVLDMDGDVYVNVEEYLNNTDPTGSDATIVYISASDSRANELDTDPGEFTVHRTGNTANALTVQYTVSGTAINGTDYTQLPGSVVIPGGASTATVTIAPVTDGETEGNETVVMSLAAGSNAYRVGCPSTSLVVISDSTPVTGVEDSDAKDGPESFVLSQNYPNPFNPETRINYELRMIDDVELAVYNTLGQKVRTLVQTRQPAGSYSVMWGGRNDAGKSVSSGVYFYKLKIGNAFVATRKMVLLR